MKRFLLLLSAAVFCLFSGPVFAESASRLFSDLNSAYVSGFYPAAVSISGKIIEQFPSSSYYEKASLIKGESLVHLGRFSEVPATLQPFADKNAVAAYWLGRAFYGENSFIKASGSFYKALALFSENPAHEGYSEKLHRSTAVYSALCLNNLGRAEEAVSLLEYAFSSFLMEEDLEPASVLLFSLYSDLEKYDEIISLYGQLENAVPFFSKAHYDYVRLCTADAYAEAGNEEKAWNAFSKLLSDCEDDSFLRCLQTAYSFAEKSRTYTTARLLDENTQRLEAYPGFMSEIYLRTALNAWNKADYKKAASCFDKAEKDASYEKKNFIALYKAEMLVMDGKYDAALELLQKTADKSSPLYAETLLAMARASAFSKKYDACRRYADEARVLVSGEEAVITAEFYAAYCAASDGQWSSVRTLLEGKNLSKTGTAAVGNLKDAVSALYAEALILSDGSPAAVNRALQVLKGRNRVIALLKAGRYEQAYQLVKDGKSKEETYLCGLAAAGCGRWAEAVRLLNDSSEYSLYYRSYSQYQLGQVKDAYKGFESFIKKNPYSKLIRDASFYAAKSALQAGDERSALEMGHAANKKSVTPAQKQETAVFCAGIYSDAGDYEKAVSIIKPYADVVEESAVPVRFMLAQIYALQGNIDAADKLLTVTENLFHKTAAESLYRRAELYFSKEHFEKAASLFAECRKKYADSEYAKASVYYNALSLEKAGRANEAILIYEKCLRENGKDYGFLCNSRLALLYKANGEYASALRCVEAALTGWPDEASSSNLGTELKELRMLASGSSEKIARLAADYEKAGGAKTEKGRNTGLQLADLYLDTVSDRGKGAEILNEIIANADTAKEHSVLGTAFKLKGLYLRMEGKETDAGEAYLTASNHFSEADYDSAAACLYSAMEVFVSIGKKADAKAVYDTMLKLYSESLWTEKAKGLL